MNQIPTSSRIQSIDLLRGLVIVIMAIDHIRDYFHADAFLFDPVDLDHTNPALFFTRWITHFCAPVFVFLAGTSAYQIGIRKGIPALSEFLFKRGLWLIILEFTVINFAWFFNIHFQFLAMTVIWALGVSMVVLALLVRLPRTFILVLSLTLIFIHNAFDGIQLDNSEPGSFVWAVLHQQNFFILGADRFLFVGYGLIPWAAVMSLGYCLGSLYAPGFDPVRRRKLLLQFGMASIVLFILLRASNLYGDPEHWSIRQDGLFTLMSFLNCNKYPPSLLYLLITLGPSMIFLAYAEAWKNTLTAALLVFGRTPMFFYILHLYLIHLFALIGATIAGYPLSSMVFSTWITNSKALVGYGFSLGVVYLVWVIVIATLYPICKWFDNYKTSHKDWWLSYL